MKANEEIKDDLTYRIIGCAMKVHAILGNGFQEVIYQRALAIAFEKGWSAVPAGTRYANLL